MTVSVPNSALFGYLLQKALPTVDGGEGLGRILGWVTAEIAIAGGALKGRSRYWLESTGISARRNKGILVQCIKKHPMEKR
jgi:hypothetical protein